MATSNALATGGRAGDCCRAVVFEAETAAEL